MRKLCLVATIILASTLGCRRKQAGGAGTADTTTAPPPAAAPAPPAPDTSTASPSFGFDQRQQFVQSIRQQLAGIDRQIKDLSAQAKSRGGAVSDRALGRIRTSRQAVDRSLRQVDAATAANWEKVKQGVTRAVDNLSETIEAAQPK
jgi:small-conductance mechanosensitive channel